jgi:TonB family protein
MRPPVANTAGTESQTGKQTGSSAGLLALSLSPALKRRRAAAAATAFSSLVWIAGLATLGYAQEALPWCITLAATAGGALLSTRKADASIIPQFAATANRQPLSFLESFALTYMLASVALSSWIIFHFIYKPPALSVKRQVIDIELTSLADFQDRHELLAGTVEKEAVRKRNGALTTSHGSLKPVAGVQSQAPPPKPSTSDGRDTPERKSEPKRMTTKQSPVNDAKMVIMQPLSASSSPLYATNQPLAPKPEQLVRRLSPVAPSPRSRHEPDDKPFMEEVMPPELVELVDNDGNKSLEIWQAGGHSAGGSGSKSDLAHYLKDLNKRIKHAWSPPRGQQRKTEVLFRISKAGQLLAVQIVRSSGSNETDEAALKAIAASAPFTPLPADYPHSYLDLHYSFNYNVDELTEVNDGQFR